MSIKNPSAPIHRFLDYDDNDRIETMRSGEEIAEAYEQAWDRVWYGRSDPDEPLGVGGRVERDMLYGEEIRNPEYYEPWGWGYLSGILAALAWVQGEPWKMLDT